MSDQEQGPGWALGCVRGGTCARPDLRRWAWLPCACAVPAGVHVGTCIMPACEHVPGGMLTCRGVDLAVPGPPRVQTHIR